MVNYLSSRNLLHNYFSYRTGARFIHVDLNETACESKIEEFRNGFYATLKAEFVADEKLVKIANCLDDQLKKSLTAEVFLKKIVFENVSLVNKKRNRALRSIDREIGQKAGNAVDECAVDGDSQKVFDAVDLKLANLEIGDPR